MSFQIHDRAPKTPIVGRVVDKHLSDELGENLTVVDGIDGRTHHIAGIAPERLEEARIGSIIEIGPAEAAVRLHRYRHCRGRNLSAEPAFGASQVRGPRSSGKFAVVEKSHDFTLVPWRPFIDRLLSREVADVVQGGLVSWQLGRQKGLSL